MGTSIIYAHRAQFEKLTSEEKVMSSDVAEQFHFLGGLDHVEFEENQITVFDIGCNNRDRSYVIRTIEGSMKQLAAYVYQNCTQTNTHYTLYWSWHQKAICHTVGSMEYRDKKHIEIISIRTGDEAYVSKAEAHRALRFLFDHQ